MLCFSFFSKKNVRTGHKQVSPELETRDEPKRHMNFSYRVLEIVLAEATSSKTFYEISELKISNCLD